MAWFGLEIEVWLTIATVVLSVFSIIIAICSAQSTAKQADKQIEHIKKLSKQQLELSEIYLSTVMTNNQHILHEMKDNLATKEECYKSGVTVMNERRDVMEKNIKRLKILIAESEKLQEEYILHKQKIQVTK